jgi:mRNA interferase HigB
VAHVFNCPSRICFKKHSRVGTNTGPTRFEVAGGNYRLIASFDFRRQIVFVKFIGTHAEYDAIDPLTVARF